MTDKFDKICICAINASYSHSSLSVRCLAKALDKDAIICEYTINDNLNKVVAELYKKACDLYAFSCYIWNIEFVLDVCQTLKKLMPDCVIMLGGPEVSYDAYDVMNQNSFIDYIICGEGEIALNDFVNGKNLCGISGLVYRESKNIVQNEIEPICELDVLPRLYTSDEVDKLKNKIIYYETSRGCPYMCTYCLSSTSHGVRFFGLDRVFADLKMFMDCKAKLVKLTDRTFNIDIERTKKILRFILEKNTQTCFHFEISADILDDETIKLLNSAPSGFFQLEIGIQSTNKNTLCTIKRKTNIEKLFNNVLRLQKEHNMHIHLDLIAGLPHENYTSFKKSFDDVFSLRPDMLQLGFLKLLKGTQIHDEADKFGYCFNQKPPYEVLFNQFISYDELIILKDVCELVEKYYNSGSFEKAIEFVLKDFSSAYDFFYEFSLFWNEKGFDKQSQSKKGLYDIFYSFYREHIGTELPKFSEYLKFDFMKNNKKLSLPQWASKAGSKTFYNSVYNFIRSEEGAKYFRHYTGAKLCDVIQAVSVEKFNFDVCNTGNFGKYVIIFDYKNNTFTKIEDFF